MTIIALVRNPDFTVFQVLELWFAFNLAPTALLLTFLNRQVRAVGPMLLVFLMMALLGAVVTTELIGKNETSLRTLISVTSAIGIGDYAFLFMFIVGFSGFSILGWLLAIWIRKGYVTKKLSDQTIVLDSIWIIFGIAYSVSLAFEDIAWILSFFVAFLLYKIVFQIGFRIANPVSANTRLLILRVFQLGKRSERIFDAITKYWRYGGSVQFIAGPDLATSTVQPHEFLAFLSKKITRLFIHTKPELDEHLSNMDLRPDFDGRFRINDFFCYESTWEMVLSKLVQHSDAVLMDLRSFSPERKGCIREISELINIVPVGRIVLVIDESTDLAFLKQTIRQYWSAMIAASPNATGIPKALRLFYTDSNQEIPIIALINELSAAN